MKFSKIVFLGAMIALTGMSCQKVSSSCEKEDANIDMSGTWDGAWGFANEIPTNFERWVMDTDGGLAAYDQDGFLFAFGTWEMDGHDFEAVYSPIGYPYSYTFKGRYEDDTDEINGTWGQTPSTTDGGTFEMSRNE